jgi:hypothetical protein
MAGLFSSQFTVQDAKTRHNTFAPSSQLRMPKHATTLSLPVHSSGCQNTPQHFRSQFSVQDAKTRQNNLCPISPFWVPKHITVSLPVLSSGCQNTPELFRSQFSILGAKTCQNLVFSLFSSSSGRRWRQETLTKRVNFHSPERCHI